MAMQRKRHGEFTEEEIKEKRRNVVPKATLKNNSKWDKAFRDYLREKDFQSTEYWCYPDEELDTILCKFWFEVRTTRPPLQTPEEIQEAKNNNKDIHPEYYTIASLRNLRNGLSRCLQEHSRNIDLTNDPKFKAN